MISLDKLQTKLRGEGGIKALLGMVRCGHPDVLAQVARGIANFAKCESRASSQGILVTNFLLFYIVTSFWKKRTNDDVSYIQNLYLQVSTHSNLYLGNVCFH